MSVMRKGLYHLIDRLPALSQVLHLGRTEAGYRRLDLLLHCLAVGYLARA